MTIGFWLPPADKYDTVEQYIRERYWRYYHHNEFVSRVASTTIAYAVGSGHMMATVSTVFLRFDHNWGGGPPILWETMVFGWPGDDNWHDHDQDRYFTPERATIGHQDMVRETEGKLEAAGFPVLATVTARCEWWKG